MEDNRKCSCCGWVSTDFYSEDDFILCGICYKTQSSNIFKNNYVGIDTLSLAKKLASQISYCTNLILGELRQKGGEHRYGK